MGKSDSRIRVKTPASRGSPKGALNGNGGARPAPEARKKEVLDQPKPIARPLLRTARKGRAREGNIVLPDGYRPSENEPFMNERHRVYFRNKLVAWKEEIIRQNRETLHILHEDSAQHADLADRATSETDRALELRARDRQRKLIAKIDAALARIEEGSYGFCEETGEPIGLKRLDARPIATLSLEAQERHERREKVFRED
jgi:RNA polymerase-binding transcription factor